MFQTLHFQCDINTQRFMRMGSVWIGMGSDEALLTHMHCPNAYCKLQETEVNLTSPDVQCAFGHSGVLCGGCESGLALMLSSSRYLLLILPFLVPGVLLVIILGRLDLTVASGTVNGVQWRSQDIAIARAQHGHTTFVCTSARSAEAYGGLGVSSPQKFRNFTASQVGSEAIYRSEV